MDRHTKQPEDQGAVRRRLGRGLNALLGTGAAKQAAESGEPEGPLPEYRQISVQSIERNPSQPRTDFAPESLSELADSIKQHGVLQPILVLPQGENFQLIAGERRWLAAGKAGLETIPCRVIKRDAQSNCEVAIEENLKRQDLNPLEKAKAFQDYRDRFGCSIEELAQKLSMKRSTVSNFLRLLELPEPVKQSLLGGKLSNGHARALLSLQRSEDQIQLCRRIERESLSVRSTEGEVRRLLTQEEVLPFPKESNRPPKTEKTSHVQSLQDQLCRHLGAKVEIRLSGPETGKLIIHFQSNDDFERLLRQLRRVA